MKYSLSYEDRIWLSDIMGPSLPFNPKKIHSAIETIVNEAIEKELGKYKKKTNRE